MKKEWTAKDIETLTQLVESGSSIDKIEKQFPERTKNALELKIKRLGLQVKQSNRKWTDDEIEDFTDDWYNLSRSMKALSKKYHRSEGALRQKAQKLGLGERKPDTYLTVQDICEYMSVTDDKVYRWLENGLKFKKGRGKIRYLITQDDLLEFLKNNPVVYDASKVSEYLFPTKPDWMKEKSKADVQFIPDKRQVEYTNEDDNRIVKLFKQGKSNADIARELRRTECGIATRLNILGLSRASYNWYEIEILEQYSDSKTVDELAAMLPLRTKEGIATKCKMLGLPYHYSKKRVKNDEQSA